VEKKKVVGLLCGVGCSASLLIRTSDRIIR